MNLVKNNIDCLINNIDIDKIDIKKSNFIYNMARDYLINTIKSREILQKKVLIILGYIFYILAFLLIKNTDIIVSNLNEKSSHCSVLIIFLIVYHSLIAGYLVVRGLFPREYGSDGGEPQVLLKKTFIEQDLCLIQIGILTNYQNYININIKNNDRIVLAINRSLILLIIAPILSLSSRIFY